MLSAASSLPTFTPARGHTYFPSTTQPQANPSSTFPVTQASETGSPAPLLTTTATEKDLPTTKESINVTEASQNSQAKTANDVQSSALFGQSFDFYLRYGAEYMDENPLTGEPGSFILSRARNGEPGLLTSSSKAKPSQQPSLPRSSSPVQGSKKSPELEVKTDVSPETGSLRGMGGSAKSPTTPGVGKKKKERRKSKAVGMEDDEGGMARGEG